ncbi:hypothetical protein SAMN05877753_12211 [Bacillus oleivorans]|uniref:HNH nuclease domain-containing protein n=1 Tax=Bacillus oleivorans TaxID=1448271 RepID=A0A285D7Z3_9BACI|nr:HNH endonuclease [Bacillus oleivorans]SNX75924.1 hypothetical protein SAMN05877753_12211 [Bacillus oleivorans]
MDVGTRAVPKPRHKRRVPKRGNLTKITQKVRKEVLRRSGGKCERCGKSQAYSFEMAHLKQASQGGSGSEPWNVALLCGPSVNSDTCHHFADYTAEGREWRKTKRAELERLYKGELEKWGKTSRHSQG